MIRNKLKVKRWEMGIKQYEMADMLGCSAPYLSMVENGRIEPTTIFKLRAAQVLNDNLETLFPSRI
jgi:DNA-binding XRE family transcriptional regulator